MQYLSKNTFGCIKGWCALGILIHHIYQFSGILDGTAARFLLINLGNWAVGLFVFMSGYGLYESYRDKGDRYIANFLRNKLLSFWILYLIVAGVYILYDFIRGYPHTVGEYLGTFTYGKTIISFGWYLQLTLVLYLVYWIAFRFGRGRGSRFAIMGVLFALFIWLNILLGISHIRYMPVLFFLLGILWAVYREQIEKGLCRIGPVVLVLAFVVSFGGYLIIWRYEIRGFMSVAVYAGSEMAMILFVMLLVRQLNAHGQASAKLICNGLSRFLGVYSLEIYVCQGIVLRTLSSIAMNKYLFAGLGILLVILIAIPVHMLFGVVNKKIVRRVGN